MRWVLLDVALCLSALAVLAGVLFRLWRRVKALGAQVSRSDDLIGTATEQLGRAQDAGPAGRPGPT